MDTEFQRVHRRAKGIAPVMCQNVVGRLNDISRGGMSFSIAAEEAAKFVIGTTYDMTIKLPQTQENVEKMEVSVAGEVRTTQLDPRKKRLILGIKFNDMPEELRQKLNKVILFFAQHFAELQELDENFSLAIPRKEAILSQTEIAQIYEWALSNFESLPEETQTKMHDYALSLDKLFKILEPKS